jgi:hypothetical protein
MHTSGRVGLTDLEIHSFTSLPHSLDSMELKEVKQATRTSTFLNASRGFKEDAILVWYGSDSLPYGTLARRVLMHFNI